MAVRGYRPASFGHKELSLLDNHNGTDSDDDQDLGPRYDPGPFAGYESLSPPDSEKIVPTLDPQPHLVAQYLSKDSMSREELVKERLTKVRELFATHDTDCGSSAVQVASLTAKISLMSEHLAKHKQDLSGKRGLMGMLAKRQKLLKYMRRKEPHQYQDVILRLGLKDRTFVESKYADGTQ